MSDKARHVVERFPDLTQAIKQCMADDRFFRALCEDYGEAVEVLRHWQRVSGLTDSERVIACRELVGDLEQEILLELQLWNDR